MFGRFPGIGPRQAKRFVYYLLSRPTTSLDELARAVQSLKKEILQCEKCMRFYAKNGHLGNVCSVCLDPHRDPSVLMVVPRDIDFEAVEKSSSFVGYYFILGGSVPILEKEPERRIRIKELGIRIEEGLKSGLKEVVLAMNANAEGENTADYIKDQLKAYDVEMTMLGRGLSTGAELEYADPETLKNAFLHRTK